MKAFLVIIAVAFLSAAVIPAYASHNAFDELDVYTNGTHYIFNKYIDNHLYGHSIVNYDGNQLVQTGTLRIDDTNANKWYPLPTLEPGRYHWDWYMDTDRTQDIDSITFIVAEPTPEPEPEPIPEPTKSDVCHNGNTINVSSNALDVHLNHGDTLGQCVVPIPTNSTESNSPCGPGTIFDTEYNACVLDKPTPQVPTQSSTAVEICHSEVVTLQEYGNSLRAHLAHGDIPGECPETEQPTTHGDYSAYSTDDLLEIFYEILEELMSR